MNDPTRAVQKIRADLAWRGPGGKPLGHVVLSRAQAEKILQLLGEEDGELVCVKGHGILEPHMIDITVRLESATLDKDNFPRMDSERQVPVGLAKEAKAEIKRLREALMNNFACGRDDCWKEGWCLRAGVKCWEGDQPRWNAIEKAVAAERERCARIAERIGVEAMDAQWDQGVEDAKRLIAAAIRGSHHPG